MNNSKYAVLVILLAILLILLVYIIYEYRLDAIAAPENQDTDL